MKWKACWSCCFPSDGYFCVTEGPFFSLHFMLRQCHSNVSIFWVIHIVQPGKSTSGPHELVLEVMLVLWWYKSNLTEPFFFPQSRCRNRSMARLPQFWYQTHKLTDSELDFQCHIGKDLQNRGKTTYARICSHYSVLYINLTYWHHRNNCCLIWFLAQGKQDLEFWSLPGDCYKVAWDRFCYCQYDLMQC